jgi:hypothetical protein
LKPDRGGRHSVAQHLAKEAALTPTQVERNAKRVGDGPAVGCGAGPVHETRPIAVDVVVVAVDTFGRDARIEQR